MSADAPVLLEDPLLNSASLRTFLRTHHVPPLDRFGQHFLIDAEVLAEIVRACATDPALPVIEIGAGLGALTRALARERETRSEEQGTRPAPLIAVELDRRLVPLLRERVRDLPEVRVVHADIVKTDTVSLLPPPSSLPLPPFDVVGNIPYNISGAILEKFLCVSSRLPRIDAERLVRGPRRLTFLIDDAVAAAVAAAPPAMSIHALSVQVFARPHIVRRRIPPTAFVPPPAVHSAILALTVRGEPLVPARDERPFFSLVRAGFSQKRKMLSNALAATHRISAAEAAARLHRAGIDPQRRAQTLSIEEWLRVLRGWPA